MQHIGTIAQAGWIALATLASGTAFVLEPDNMLIPIGVVITIVGATWFVSRRVAKFEDRVAALEEADDEKTDLLREINKKLERLNHG